MHGLPAQTAVVSEETDFLKLSLPVSSLEIREADTKGKGVFAAKPFAQGEVVIVGEPFQSHSWWEEAK